MAGERSTRGPAFGSRLERRESQIEGDRGETLVCLAEATAWAANRGDVDQNIVDMAAMRFGCDEVYLHRFVDEQFVCTASHAQMPLAGYAGQGFSMGTGRVGWMVREVRPVFYDYGHPQDDDVSMVSLVAHGYKSSVTLPLMAKAELVGALSIVYKRDNPWREEDADFLLGVGRLLGAICQRMQKSAHEVEYQLLNERKRLSIEIHDSVAQLASSLSVAADTVLTSYDLGCDAAVKLGLRNVGEISRQLNRALRDEMVSLRTPLEETDGLVRGIQTSLARLQAQWGIQTSFDVKSDVTALPLQVELQVMRIVSESLSNVVKHAKATCVAIVLEMTGADLTISVKDDGCGFDADNVASDRLGLLIMEERARAMGGCLDVSSDVRGTVITVIVPLP